MIQICQRLQISHALQGHIILLSIKYLLVHIYRTLHSKSWRVRFRFILHLAGCYEAFGIENGKITDNQLESSSALDDCHGPEQARLNNERAWVAKTNDENQRLTINLGNKYNRITRIATQGSPHNMGWVTSYKLEYSSATGASHKVYQKEVSMNCCSILLYDRFSQHVEWNFWRSLVQCGSVLKS